MNEPLSSETKLHEGTLDASGVNCDNGDCWCWEEYQAAPKEQPNSDQSNRNQAVAASSGAENVAPTPKGSLPNSLGNSLDRLAIYGRMVLDESRESLGDLDGGWLQDKAIECGLLEEVTVNEPCGENCRCAEYDDFPQRCLRLTEAAKAVTVTEQTT